MADAVHARTHAATNNPTNENEDLDGGDDIYDDGEEEGDDDDIDAAAEAAAEEIARRLGAQLWESISKAQAEGATLQAAPTKPPTKREEAALATMRNVLAFVDRDPLARSTLASTPVLECEGRTLLDVLMGSVAAGRISKAVARPLSTLMLNLSQSEILFASLEQMPVQQDKAKRKRSDSEEEDSSQDPSPRLTKRPCYTPYDLRTQIIEAVRTIVETFASNQKASVDASVISSMQLQLHQVFLFAVTSSASSGPEMSAMREISGLIQALAVLSGIQIGGPSSAHPPHSHTSPAPSTWGMIPPPVTDIGTAVYPCIVPTCPKVFSRLSFLRAHQQRVHALHRPFTCSSCSAAFARNHDLKRHAQLHEKKAWKCGGCEKIFSRRDAIKRHKNNGSSRGRDGQPCLNKKVIEVDLEKTEGEETDGRRTKVRTASGPVPVPIQHDDGLAPEEGEILPNVIAQLQAAVLSLIEPLRAHMRQALISGPQQTLAPPTVGTDTTGGQATLASVIAHVQAQTSGNLGTTTMTQDPVEVGPLVMYGLSEEQTRMLQQAIANAASAAQAQAEAEAALEEEEEEEAGEDGDLCGGEDDGDGSGEDVDDGKTADGSAFDSPIQPDSTG
jgi:hypothetical protein